MKLVESIKAAMNSVSIRRKLLVSFIVASGIMGLIVLYVVLIFGAVVDSVSVSYRTNAKLDAYSALLAQTESSLEQYMELRSFESIDTFDSTRAKLETATQEFTSFPSADEVSLLEYKVYKLVETFVGYADSAVYARRANTIGASDAAYVKAVKAYRFLTDAISQLNNCYFRRNIVQYNASLETVRKISLGCIGFTALIVLLDLILVLILVTNITKPLVEISDVAHRLAERDFDIPLFAIKTQDEVGNICRAFNRMIISIREYIDTIWEKAVQETELREKEIKMSALYKDAQLKSLQAQINPHFLFNTLNTGAQLAMMEGADKTCFFIEQVADFFRYNIQQIDRDTTLQDELRIVDNYVYIMNVRFGSKFRFEKNITTSNVSVRMPSMILQPLIEDCIRHGLYDLPGGGIIALHIYEQDGYLVITISDNGKGFPPDKREEVLSKTAPSAEIGISSSVDMIADKGIGLYNVIARLRLYFNTPNVFDITANPDGIGTCFVIRIGNV